MKSLLSIITKVIAVFSVVLVGHTQDVLVLDFPGQPRDEAPPVGLSDWPIESFEGLASIRVPLLSLNDDGCLLVTVVFEDAEERIIAAKWKTPEEEVILASNLSDGVAGLNQRTFKIPYENLQLNGDLVLETDAETQPIKRVVLAWTWPIGIYMSPGAREVRIIQDAETLYTDRDLKKSSNGPTPDSWTAGVWKASLQEQIEPLSQNTEFVVPFQTLPRAVIFRASVFGFSMDEAPEMWVNGRKISIVSMEVPSLGKAAYFQGDQDRMQFAGWRKVEAVLPASVFNTGENSIILSGKKGAYINDAVLELNFEGEGAPLTLPGREIVPAQKSSEPIPIAIEPTVIVTPPSI